MPLKLINLSNGVLYYILTFLTNSRDLKNATLSCRILRAMGNLLQDTQKQNKECHENSDIFTFEDLYDLIDTKRNILIHSAGGTGKSYTIKKLAQLCTCGCKNVAMTGTTGVAAVNISQPEYRISARTIHSWAFNGLGDSTVEEIYANLSDTTKLNWLETDVLIIDEISMMGASLFDKLDLIGRRVRKVDLPLGGITVVATGDFLQLPPINDKWVFDSKSWKSLRTKKVTMKTPYRYTDVEYYKFLQRIRIGKFTQGDAKKLLTRAEAYNEYQESCKNSDILTVKPTVLYSRKKDVDTYNYAELKKLPGKPYYYEAIDEYIKYHKSAKKGDYLSLIKNTSPDKVPIKVGAQVMLTVNTNVSEGLVNGSRGVVIAHTPHSITVRFKNGKEDIFKMHNWVVEDKWAKMTRTQLPFILAYSITIHKSQSATLDCVVCDLGWSIFCDGQAYVALSRVRNFESLYLSALDLSRIKCNKRALKYSNRFDEIAKNLHH